MNAPEPSTALRPAVRLFSRKGLWIALALWAAVATFAISFPAGSHNWSVVMASLALVGAATLVVAMLLLLVCSHDDELDGGAG